MKLFSLCFLFLISFLSGCNERVKDNQTDDWLVTQEYLQQTEVIQQSKTKSTYLYKSTDGKYFVYFEYYPSGKISNIHGTLLDLNFGCSFQFAVDGHTEDFHFDSGDGEHATYVINKEKDLYSEQGDAFVNYITIKPTALDSLRAYDILFSTFPRKNIVVNYSLDGIRFSQLPLTKSELLPLVDVGRLSIRKAQKQVILKINCDHLLFDLNGLPDSRASLDTIQF